MRRIGKLGTLIAFLGIFTLIGCGDSPTQPPPPPPAPVVPSAAVQGTGNGIIFIGPSLDPAFCCSTMFPIMIQETAGGTAIWNFFRVSYFLNGVEVERSEVGSTIIREGGFRDITPNSTIEPDVLVRSNVVDFDDIRITLGFADTKDRRSFEEMMDLESFDGVGINPIPTVIPDGAEAAVVESSR